MLFEGADNRLLKGKMVNVLITNKCNLQCGGCHQFCGLITKNYKSRIWNISPKQLDENIKVLTHPKGTNPKRIGIFGGETTLHPQWGEILKVVKNYSNVQFDVWTNGTRPEKLIVLPNVRYRIGDKQSMMHRATLVAACDIYKKDTLEFYWEIAHRICRMWKQCRSVVYDNRAYLCEPAAAFDRLELGSEKWDESKGWKLKLGENPFNRTQIEIAKQGKSFCYRCGFCIEEEIWQKVSDPDLITDTNLKLLNKLGDSFHYKHYRDIQ